MNINASLDKQLFTKPIFIVSAPRSGSTLLFETLINSSHLWSIQNESHAIYAKFPELAFENEAQDSACLNANHYNSELASLFKHEYFQQLKNNRGLLFTELAKRSRPARAQFIEKTPRNSLNIPFLLNIFPDARFIYLYRKPEENINSIIDGWERKGSFVRFTNLPDWPLGYWCFLLPSNWRTMKTKSIPDIAAFQWKACNEKIMQDLAPLPKDRVVSLSYQQLVNKTPLAIKKICTAFNIPIDKSLYDVVTANELPLSATTVSKPATDKWRAREDQILPVLPTVEDSWSTIKTFNSNH